MTLIMSNLGFSISLLAMVISLSLAYLRYKIDIDDREKRRKRREAISKAMTEAYFEFHRYDNK